MLGPKYDPKFPHLHRTQITVEHLYLLMGRELEELNQVPAGNVFGIGWNFGSGSTNASIATAFLKTATLSSVLECPSFGSLKLEAAPIVRVALEPRDPGKINRKFHSLICFYSEVILLYS